MKKLLLLALGLLLLPFTSSATGILIYKHKYSFTRTGGTNVIIGKVSGWTLIDPATGDAWFIRVNLATKKFQSDEVGDSDAQGIIGKRGAVLSVIAFSIGDIGCIIARGKNSKTTLPQGEPPDESWDAPKTLTLTGNALQALDGLGEVIYDYRGSLSYDESDTVAANQAGLDIEESADMLTQGLLNAGYTEE